MPPRLIGYTGRNHAEQYWFWARGYAVSTVGFEEEQVRGYIRHQEQLDTPGPEEDGEF